MTRYHTVLFDLDGTLADSVRLILDSYHHTMAAHNLAPRTDEFWLAGLGTPLTAQFAEWVDSPAQLEAMIMSYREYNLRHHDAQVSAYPGVVEMVTRVRRSGLRTGLVTSKNRSGALRGLRVIGLEGVMEVVVGADDVDNHKPHPEPVHRALEQLGSEATGTIFVGDSLHDMYSGRQAGTHTGAVLWGPFDRGHLNPSAPDHWLETPDALTALLGV